MWIVGEKTEKEIQEFDSTFDGTKARGQWERFREEGVKWGWWRSDLINTETQEIMYEHSRLYKIEEGMQMMLRPSPVEQNVYEFWLEGVLVFKIRETTDHPFDKAYTRWTFLSRFDYTKAGRETKTREALHSLVWHPSTEDVFDIVFRRLDGDDRFDAWVEQKEQVRLMLDQDVSTFFKIDEDTNRLTAKVPKTSSSDYYLDEAIRDLAPTGYFGAVLGYTKAAVRAVKYYARQHKEAYTGLWAISRAIGYQNWCNNPKELEICGNIKLLDEW